MDFGEEQVFPRGRLFLDAPDVVHEVDDFHHIDGRRGGSRAADNGRNRSAREPEELFARLSFYRDPADLPRLLGHRG